MPQKPLSVTDLVSPAWCELQYWFTLTKFGRKPQTQAMKQGSKVHRILEEQIHTTVPVRVESKEDKFGLKIWNTIQGLRTLKETGLTRELEVWGVINGQVVNGIIDEISYNCPDPEMEEVLRKKAEKNGGTLSFGQLNIEQNLTGNTSVWPESLGLERQVYIADVKTRGIKSLPTGVSLRPTWMQLMLYRKLLESLSLNTVDAETIFARYNLRPLEPFSTVFMREVESIGDETSNTVVEAGSKNPLMLADMFEKNANPFSTLQAIEIQAHNCLLALWSLMISEFSQTISMFSDILRAEFRYSKTGEIIGSSLIIYDEKVIQDYIDKSMQWWGGEREAQGVEIEEAFKCGMCNFADQCRWRQAKVEEALEKSRLRSKVNGKSTV